MRMKVTNLPLLRGLVDASGLTHREIADKTGISHGTIGNLLAGRRSGCSGEVYTALLDTLGLELRRAFEPRRTKAMQRQDAA